jgi:hypothetical protein
MRLLFASLACLHVQHVSAQSFSGHGACRTDLNMNGVVDVTDVLLMLGRFGTSSPGDLADFDNSNGKLLLPTSVATDFVLWTAATCSCSAQSQYHGALTCVRCRRCGYGRSLAGLVYLWRYMQPFGRVCIEPVPKRRFVYRLHFQLQLCLSARLGWPRLHRPAGLLERQHLHLSPAVCRHIWKPDRHRHGKQRHLSANCNSSIQRYIWLPSRLLHTNHCQP